MLTGLPRFRAFGEVTCKSLSNQRHTILSAPAAPRTRKLLLTPLEPNIILPVPDTGLCNAASGRAPASLTGIFREGACMEQVTETRSSKGYFRSSPSTAFDQYLQDIQKLPLIDDPEEERRLARRAQRGDEKAAERLVTANLRFVISYVKKYQGHGLDLSELVAIGNEGLRKAVKKFDPDQGVKSISYAVWWVRQAVLKALAEQTRSVRIPLNQNSQLIRMSRTETYLTQEMGREPTDDEIARALDDSVDNVRSARRMTAAEISLDAPIDRTDKDAATVGERFAGEEGSTIEETTDGKLQR